MRNDIKAVGQTVEALKIRVHQVGDWAVAQQPPARGNGAYTNREEINTKIDVTFRAPSSRRRGK
ncbi:hypothetical protein [Actinomadura sp. RB99]|uniref:hypothetical protein n=1 Tax=Actinomadura sp. RB99 TaxID=2691577 RepID=UPI0016898BFE|nr:hypothetical protein [Actinomadura sp. RB99]